MEKRTKEQCYQRYNNSLRDDLRKGAFTEEEDFMIMVGVRIFGTQWVKIADFMTHRSPVQLHSRYNSFLCVNFDSWTPEVVVTLVKVIFFLITKILLQDDYKLLALVKTHGSKDWVKISQELGVGTKTRTQCRNRFFIIYKW